MTTAPDPVTARQTGKGALYLAVALTAVVVYLGALRNGYALDDVLIVAMNPLTHHLGGAWQAFREPYWPATFSAAMYRPLPIASFVLDLQLDHVAWLHTVNLLWNAGVSVLVAAVALRWTGSTNGAWLAGLVFAVHPVHVEAVANLVGRADLMATLFTVLAVYLALQYDRFWLSLAALALGLLSKENAAIAPVLIAWGWVAGIGRPTGRRRMWAYAGGWLAVGAAYAAVRWTVLHPYARLLHLAPVFVESGPGAVRLTAIAALADVVRLLLFPVTLRVDYSFDFAGHFGESAGNGEHEMGRVLGEEARGEFADFVPDRFVADSGEGKLACIAVKNARVTSGAQQEAESFGPVNDIEGGGLEHAL